MRRSLSSSLTAALLLTVSVAKAQSADPVNGAAFLLIPMGGRAVALGQAAVAAGGSAEAVFWNPAGLASSPASEVALHYSSTFASENSAVSLALVGEGVGVIGLSFFVADFGSQDIVTANGSTVGRFSPKHLQLLASLATDVADRLALGVNYKFIQFRQDCTGTCGGSGAIMSESQVGTTHAIDAGIQYSAGSSANLTLGVVLKNAGLALAVNDPDRADALPTRIQFGGLYRLPLQHSDNVQRIDISLLADLENELGGSVDHDARVGIEVSYAGTVQIRSGYAFLQSAARGPSLGVGLNLGGWTLDVARVFFEQPTLEEPFFVTLRAEL